MLKQERNRSHLYLSHFFPLTPVTHEQSPECLKQFMFTEPPGSHLHATTLKRKQKRRHIIKYTPRKVITLWLEDCFFAMYTVYILMASVVK